MVVESNHKDAPWPLYQQVKNLIVRRIESGHWSPGTKIPSENELVDSLGISRMTINRAIRELSAEGHLIRKRGAGTFVKVQKPQLAFLEIRSIADEIADWGGEHHSDVVLLRKEPADTQLCNDMGLKEKSEVFHSIIIHKDRDVPIQLAERFVNPTMAPDYLNQDFTRITPSKYLLGVASVTEVEHVVETSIPDREMTKHLNMKAGEPCLVLHITTWFKNVVVTRNRFIYPGSRYSIGGKFKTNNSNHHITV